MVLLWSCLNFAVLSLEAVGRAIGRSSTYKQLQQGKNDLTIDPQLILLVLDVLTDSMERRFNAFLASILLLISTCTNLYFMSGLEVSVQSLYDSMIYFQGWSYLCHPNIL